MHLAVSGSPMTSQEHAGAPAVAAQASSGHPYGPTHLAVLHVDVDAFFAAVEVLRNPSLAGKPLAVRQDQDVICVNHLARARGVAKHMAVPKVADMLRALGGAFPHVFCEADGRVSYRPYREASAALLRLLKGGLPPAVGAAVLVVEKASIDEAYLLVDLGAAAAAAAAGTGAAAAPAAAAAGSGSCESLLPGLDVALAGMPAWVSAAQQAGCCWDLSAAAAVANAVRAAVLSTLCLTVSVGVAPNRLLAKLASRAAKPDGVFVVDSVATVQQLLAATDVERLPGCGGALADAMHAAGIRSIAQLQATGVHQLELLCGSPSPHAPALALRLAAVSWGRDTTAVVDRGPPKSLQVQMTLSAVRLTLLPGAHSNQQQQAAGPGASGGASGSPAGAGAGRSSRLLTHCADTQPRLVAVLRAMLLDLLGRVMLDRHAEDRWPSRLVVRLTLVSNDSVPGAPPQPQQRNVSRSGPFPPPPGAVRQQQQQQDAAGSAAAAAFHAPGVVGERSFDVCPNLQEAALEQAAALAQALTASLPHCFVVLQANLTANAFVPFEAANRAAGQRDIRQHFARVTAPARPAEPAAAPPVALAATHALSGDGLQQLQEQPLPQEQPQPEQHHSMQQQGQHAPSQLPAASQQLPAAGAPAAAAWTPGVLAPLPPGQVPQQPPVPLSQLLLGLAHPQLSAAAAEQQLELLLAAVGAAAGASGPLPRVLPGEPAGSEGGAEAAMTGGGSV